jgi:very-short-patch-repair endonuclease
MLKYNNKLIPIAKKLRKNMTKKEKILWYNFLKDYHIKFYRQKVIENYIADFYCHEAKLVIEIDGKHHLQEEYKSRDKFRTEYMVALDLKTIRFTNNQLLNNPKYVFNQIEKNVLDRIEK